jgi:hypothetical protein
MAMVAHGIKALLFMLTMGLVTIWWGEPVRMDVQLLPLKCEDEE